MQAEVQRVKYFIQHEFRDYAVYRYRMEMDWLPDESEPLEPGIYGEDDPYLKQFEEDFRDTSIGMWLHAAHGHMISLMIQRGQW